MLETALPYPPPPPRSASNTKMAERVGRHPPLPFGHRGPIHEMFLDDALLDGNMADILFSVEALWPKKKK